MSEPGEKLKERVRALVGEQRGPLIELSTRIHAHPELKFEEHCAAEWLSDYLTGVGFDVELGAFGLPTAFAARAG